MHFDSHLSRTAIAHQPFQKFLSRDHNSYYNSCSPPPTAKESLLVLTCRLHGQWRIWASRFQVGVFDSFHSLHQQQSVKHRAYENPTTTSENRVSPLSTTHGPRKPKTVPEEAEDRFDLQVFSCRFVLCAPVFTLRGRQVLPANIPAEKRSTAGGTVLRWLLEVLQIYLVFLGCAAVLTLVTYLYIWYFEK